ncbi:MAG: hypothetical protein BWZ07_01781 [Alphaproteobacteria bacterium ADurb.BinA280]|nr:lipase [Xanthomonadales bacterium]OPZ11782.1 MAG: hypothetical protein BWZ07_01781 [Alphaproteobacteria bacterium ADurb.BinA280]
MQARLTLSMALSALLLSACSSSSNSPRAVATAPATNDSGSAVNGVITARFNPSAGVVPLPNNLLLSGTRDLTLNIPLGTGNPADFSNPQVALNTLDGWSTTTPWTFAFSAAPNPATVIPGQSVRMFQVTLTGPGGGTNGLTRELVAGVDFVTAPVSSDTTGRTFAVVPLKPLAQMTSYMVVVTDNVRDARGNDATPEQTYFLTKRTAALCSGGVSTEPMLPTATACALEPLRQLTNSHLAVAAAAGIPRDEVVVSWVATTQSVTPVMQTVRAITQPGAATLVPTGMTTAAAGLPPVADIYIGTLTVPYYLSAPSAENPTAPLNGFWKAAPGAYISALANAGLDPTSTNITFANPIPVATGSQTIPVIATVPNAASNQFKPSTGWPVVIFQHGITRNRSDALAIAATLAGQGFAVIAIDLPLHGLPASSPFNIENSPFGPAANERTFAVDYVNNSTGAAGPDGNADDSGTHFINLSSLLTSRDNVRQGVADLFVLAKTIPSIDFDGNGADFDGSRIAFTGQSLGSIVGTQFVALEPTVNQAVLSVPGGGIARLLEASPTFGPRIRAGLAASAGLQPGTPNYDSFFGATQQAIDSADPVNYAFATLQKSILLHEVVGNGTDVLPDQVIPNAVAGAPLSGTEPLIRAFGLSTLTSTTLSDTRVRGVVRFVAGDHGSLLSPTASLLATMEMQGQMASFLASGGTAVLIQNSSVIRTQ